MSYYVTFVKQPGARTGNILFQYLVCKLIGMKYGHIYVPIEQTVAEGTNGTEGTIINDGITEGTNTAEPFRITEDSMSDILSNTDQTYDWIASRNIVCDGFFQRSEYYVPYRAQLLAQLPLWMDDYWIGHKGHRQYIRDFLECTHRHPEMTAHDIVVSLRLDDFIQLPCATSDIVPPEHYLDIIEREMSERPFAKLYIVCDTIRHEWERHYVAFFQKWSPILLQEDLMHDCAVLLHSNSTLCWFLSFLSTTKRRRYIVRTHFYGGQSLSQIEASDRCMDVAPLSHAAVYQLHVDKYVQTYIHPLSYCIPDECIVADERNIRTGLPGRISQHIPYERPKGVQEEYDTEKTIHTVIAPLIPGDRSTYCFGPTQECEYNRMYQTSMCAYTQKKGGWDCLRHYEILANGCIPIFADIEQCPSDTMTTFPKKLVIEAGQHVAKWTSGSLPVDEAYHTYRRLLLQHTRDHCSTSANAAYMLSKLQISTPPKHILLITGHRGVNYTRDLCWIGIKRHIQSLGGVAVEYPPIEYLYDSFPESERSRLVGNGFTYTRRLKYDHSFTPEQIIENIQNKFFDVIIYGKVGPDEFEDGSHPTMPLWDHVFKRYTRHEIVFLYGGDECTDMTTDNRYRQHVLHTAQYGTCFVRELRK